VGEVSPWRVEPREGELAPEGQLELRVVVHLRDTLPFQGRLQVCIQDSQTYDIPLSCTGVGSTIVSDWPLYPRLDLGTHFRYNSSPFSGLSLALLSFILWVV
ncbi:unnamed protein product, partial [Boreogadus saida]